MRLLQVLPTVLRRFGDGVEIDVDFSVALRIHLENFDTVVVACPVTESRSSDEGLDRCVPLSGFPLGRVEIIELPRAYRLKDYVSYYRSIRSLLREEVRKADYIVVSPHSLIGDWPTVAIHEAIRAQKHYVLEADVVYETLGELAWQHDPLWKKIIKSRGVLPLFRLSYRRNLRHSRIAVLQGQDVYDAYAPYCSLPYKTHFHVPIYKNDHITEEALTAKLRRAGGTPRVRICYAGRAVPMKGPMDWLNTIHELLKRGVNLQATWIGDGALLPLMKEFVAERGIGDRVTLPGFISERTQLLNALNNADIFLFCHKTRESARCLGEALACGCALVGYSSAYPVDIVASHGGGSFADQNDWTGLADIIQRLVQNPEELRRLIRNAARSGADFDRDVGIREKIEFIKRHIHA